MALALVGEAALSAAFQSLFERIASFEFLDYFRGRKKHSDHLDKLVKMLKLVLESVIALLDDAEKKQMRDKPGVKGWLDELQDAAYDADDLLDEIEYEALKLKVEADPDYSSANTSEVRDFSKRKRKFGQLLFSSSSSNDIDMESKIKMILDRLEDIVEQKDRFNLKEGTVGGRPWQRLPSTSLVDNSGVYGREEDKDVVVKLVMSNDLGSKEICVIPIVGMGGVGKTTLAQVVFNDDMVKEMFEFRVWVCVSENFGACKVTKTILEGVTSNACNFADLNSLQIKLKERLTGKKLLVVLDDVWNENQAEWDVLKRPFKDVAQGSKIIVTTRSKMVASIMGTVPTHNLKELTEQDCWQLFAKHASKNGDFTIYPELISIGKDIVNKCKGLPLAAKTLGGLLSSSLDVVKWDGIAKSDIWELKNEQSDILPALRLSYHYLPLHLKRCFVYCSIFPKDYEFDKKNLVLLWMAENLVGYPENLLEYPKENRRVEEIGDEFFNDLVSRSFFQLSITRKSSFVMHGLMHDLAKFVSRDYCLLLEDENSNKLVKTTRHLACTWAKSDPLMISNFVIEGTHLRTFLPNVSCDYSFSNHKTLCVDTLNDLLSKLRCLRVLSLYGFENIIQLPDSISELRHLRYLDLSRTGINELPESVSVLYNLQTLKLAYCKYLKRLPNNMHRIINLRHLDVSESGLVEMPRHLCKLKKLQTLSIFIVGKDSGTKIGELGELSSLRGGLHIRRLENVVNVEDASNQAKLMEKKHLETVGFEWSGDYSPNDFGHERGTLDMLLPNETIKELKIHGYSGTKFSNWVGNESFCNIVSIELSRCRYCLFLPPLGQLPSLKILKISSFDAVLNVGVEFYGNSSTVKPFSSLEILKFSCMPSWENWNLLEVENERTFAKLKELEISSCDKLIGNLSFNLLLLEKLTIKKCGKLDCSLLRMPSIRKLEFGDCQILLTKVGSFFEALKQMEAYPRHLSIDNCYSLISIGCLSTTLETLNLRSCEKLEFPLNYMNESLKELALWVCDYPLRSIPLDSFPKLEKLDIRSCRGLESLIIADHGQGQELTRLFSLNIVLCPNFVSFPRGGLPSPNLTSLNIWGCNKLESLPKLHLLPSLKSLVIINCPEIESFPEGGLPVNLSSLHISFCNKLIASRVRVPWNLQRLPNLTSFTFGGCVDVEFFPDEEGLLLPPTITFLSISYFPLLIALDENRLRQLTSLKQLQIFDCPKLLRISQQWLPTSLQYLDISNCPELQKLPGRQLIPSLKCLTINKCPVLVSSLCWNDIADIPCIEIDHNIVSQDKSIPSNSISFYSAHSSEPLSST